MRELCHRLGFRHAYSADRRRWRRILGRPDRRPTGLLRACHLIADYDGARATGLAARIGDERLAGIVPDASADAVAEACRAHGITHVLNVAG